MLLCQTTEAVQKENNINKDKNQPHALAAFGVAFLGVVFFLGVVAFLGAAAFFAAGSFFSSVAFFFGAAVFFAALAFGSPVGALLLVTRPDLVLPRTRDTCSSTAGLAEAVLRGLLALALGLAAAALVVVAAAFFGRLVAAFFLGAALVAVSVSYKLCQPWLLETRA